MGSTITVRFANGVSGDNYRVPVTVPAGITYRKFFQEQMPKDNPNNYNTRVNGLPVDDVDAPVRDGDRITATPKNVKGQRHLLAAA